MQILPVDLISIVAVIMGLSIVLIPVMGLTARFALKPFVESLGQFFHGRNVEENVKILERRMALLEQQIESMDHSVRRLSEVAEFDEELRAGKERAALEGSRATGGGGA